MNLNFVECVWMDKSGPDLNVCMALSKYKNCTCNKNGTKIHLLACRYLILPMIFINNTFELNGMFTCA